MSSIASILEAMDRQNMPMPKEKKCFRTQNAEAVLREAMSFFLNKEGRELVWKEEYSEIVEWLSDNKGRGLYLHGQKGTGKTVLTRRVLPAILLKYHGIVATLFNAEEMNVKLDYALTKRVLSLDDVGIEDLAISYGVKRLAFFEIMDMAEKNNNLVLCSTNLTKDEMEAKYGDRTMDRIIATTKRVLFTGESLRK